MVVTTDYQSSDCVHHATTAVMVGVPSLETDLFKNVNQQVPTMKLFGNEHPANRGPDIHISCIAQSPRVSVHERWSIH